MADGVPVTLTAADYADALTTATPADADRLAHWVEDVTTRAFDGPWTTLEWLADPNHLFGGPPHPDITVIVTPATGAPTVVVASPPPLPPAVLVRIAAR